MNKIDKSQSLSELIQSSQTEFIMEAHSGLSAKIIEEAGFKGIWASGLAISASLGVRDNNEASWTQVLDVCEFMSDVTTIPILLDGDTGFGNFNNMRRLVKKLEQRDIAGVCIEDKLFPKTNSFIGGEMQPLADIDEFCGKVKAAKDTQSDENFCVVARVEAFIAGWGLEEALRRGDAYREAGADAILIHSKKNDSSDIEAFMGEWSNRHPVIIVPTKYYSTPTIKFEDLGVNLIIWANHTIRSSISAMKQTAKTIFQEQNIYCVQDDIEPVSEIFRLQGAHELKKAEKKYLPTEGRDVNAIILAASQGNFGDLTKKVPKTLLKIKGNKTILSTQVDAFNKVGIKDISVVRGFGKEAVTGTNISTINNDQYMNTKELYSLYLAKDQITKNTVISFGDIIFKEYILNELLNEISDITIIVDADWNLEGKNIDYVNTDIPYSKKVFSTTTSFISMSNNMKEKDICGEFIGLWKISGKGSEHVHASLEKLRKLKGFNNFTIIDLFNDLVKRTEISVKFIKGSWLDIDTIVDLQKSGAF
jgi:phosphoenolpyruvate phosphomutase